MPQLIFLQFIFHVGLVEKQKGMTTNNMLFIIIFIAACATLLFGLYTLWVLNLESAC